MKDPIDSRRLLAFYTLAQVNSFTEAGRLLGRTQSAISHAILGLERELGTRLFRRHRIRSTLTEAGEQLLAHAVRILAHMQQAREEIRASSGGRLPPGRVERARFRPDGS
ncbi:transcriptional regulator [Opitutaceae bacterium TAV1]|nr:transcriptional regulator [Opitutaceae bacterium TAV1]